MKLQTAKGVRDIPPQDKVLKNKVVETITKIFQLYGFSPLETPIIERYETLAAKFAAGVESEALKETFKLTDQGKRKLALRFDLTVPLARYMAMNPAMKMPFKRYEVGPVFRDGPIKAGRVRQFWQCDADIIGTSSMLAEAELLAILQTAFKELNLNIEIKVNNRKLLTGILAQAGIKKYEQAIIAIDKLDKIGEKGVRKELLERKYSKKQIDQIFELIKPGIKLKDLKKKLTNQEALEGINELEELFSYLKIMKVSKAVFDVSLARGLAYYTGTVFEVFNKKGKITSSLAAGGRWDNMIGNFMGANRIVPAVGLAFGIVPIMETLKLENKTVKQSQTKVYIVPIKTVKESLTVAQELRSSGVACSFNLGKKGVTKNLEYASSLNIPYVILIGEKELAKNKVLLRNMLDGNEQLLTVKQIIKKL